MAERASFLDHLRQWWAEAGGEGQAAAAPTVPPGSAGSFASPPKPGASASAASGGTGSNGGPQPALQIPAADSLVAKAIGERALFDAWERVAQNDGAAGVDGQSIQAFGANALGRLQHLRGEVLKGQYRPQPLKRVEIPKPDGRMRVLAIPAVRDRVLQTALANALRPMMEAEFEDASYGYRAGRSVGMAIARVARYRDAGLRHVVDGDIEDFFDRVDHRLLMGKLQALIPDVSVHNLVALWLAAIVQDGNRKWLLERGVPQGSPLSPMLSNLYLDSFDEELLAAGLRLVRYADDFVVLCPSPEAARDAMNTVRDSLGRLKLQLNAGKTRLTHFDQGFVFLGVRFQGPLAEAVVADAEPWLLPDEATLRRAALHEAREAAKAATLGAPDHGKPAQAALAQAPKSPRPSEAAPHRLLDADTDHTFGGPGDLDAEGAAGLSRNLPAVQLLSGPGQAEPLLQSLYVGEPGSAVLKEGERVTVTHRRAVVASVPFGQLDQLVVQAPALISTSLLLALSERRIGVCINDHGQDVALTLDSGALPDLERHSLQLRRHRHAGFNLLVARACVEGKLHNSKLILRRFNRREPSADVQARIRIIDDCLARSAYAHDLDTLRGFEGAAARAYFEALRLLLPPECGFPGRRRRPPKDMVNALLSYGYAVLAAQVQTFIRREGLNVHYGHLHATAPNSMALVSDLMEEFRPLIVDAVVLTVLRETRLSGADFEWDAGAELPCRLNRAARKTFTAALEDKLESRFIHPREKRLLDFRRAIQAQVRHYAQVLARQVPAYLPLKLK